MTTWVAVTKLTESGGGSSFGDGLFGSGLFGGGSTSYWSAEDKDTNSWSGTTQIDDTAWSAESKDT